MIRILLDTCVWLNLAGDYRNLPLLYKMSAMVDEEEIEFIVPSVVIDEFNRNKPRVMKTSKASQKELFKQVRATVKQLGIGDTDSVLTGILDVENKLHMHPDGVDQTFAQVEVMMTAGVQVVPSTLARSRAATRGLDQVAPFKSNGSGIADAVILETFYEIFDENRGTGEIYAFITSNTTDFTDPHVDKRRPHKDIEVYFNNETSVFSTDIAKYFNHLMIGIDPHGVFDEQFLVVQDPRVSSEIESSIERLWNQAWYTRHLYSMAAVEEDEVEVVDEIPKDMPYDRNKVTKANLATFRAAGERMKEKYNDDPAFFGPFSDFEWGMINGKLSALRWVMGGEWDFLDT